MKQLKVLGLVVAGIMFASAPALSAVLQVTSGPPATTIAAATDAPFDLTAETGLNGGSSIYVFDSASTTPFGLSLSEAANLTFTYLGGDASLTNIFTTAAGVFSNDGSNSTGDSFSGNYAADFLDFVLSTSGSTDSAANNGAITSPLQFALAMLTDTSVIVLFDDRGVDTDLDDLAVRIDVSDVSQVPLPPAVWLLLSAIFGLMSFARIRRASTRAA